MYLLQLIMKRQFEYMAKLTVTKFIGVLSESVLSSLSFSFLKINFTDAKCKRLLCGKQRKFKCVKHLKHMWL